MKRLLALVAGVCLMGLIGTMLAAPASLYVGKLTLDDVNFNKHYLTLYPPDNTYKHLIGHHVFIGKHFVVYNIKDAKCEPGYLYLELNRTQKQPPKSAGSYLHSDQHEFKTIRVPLENVQKWGRVVHVCPERDYQYITN